MKKFLTLSLILSVTVSFSQEVFKDGKKYGVSKYGANPADDKNDSLIFRAEYDQIEPVFILSSFVQIAFKALKNDEWCFLTTNKLVNQQRYESIFVVENYYFCTNEIKT